MRDSRLEHVNVTARNPQKVAALLVDLFDWKIRWEGPSALGGYTVHVGTDDAYLAVYSRDFDDTPERAFRKGRPLNHIGIVVADLDAVEARVCDAGLKPFGHAEYDPGRRFYFLDFDGTEYEVVSYD